MPTSHPLAILLLLVALSLDGSSGWKTTVSNREPPATQATTTLLPRTKPSLLPLVVDEQPLDDFTKPHSADSTTVSPQEHTTTITIQPTNKPHDAKVLCDDDNYCLNGGTCISNESGQMTCICPDGFYGVRCQTRNICRTVIIDSLTGDQICAKINRDCMENDKFFRCSCMDDEYFVFKIQTHKNTSTSTSGNPNDFRENPDPKPGPKSAIQRGEDSEDSQVFYTLEDYNLSQLQSDQFYLGHMAYSSSLDRKANLNGIGAGSSQDPSYIAVCKKIDKCLGVRCRRLSEVCSDGECVCNQESGYSRDPRDGLCRLIDRCRLPPPDGVPICGQAKCVATYDSHLYRCVCPVGYKAVKKDAHKNSTQCVLLRDLICEVPLLNKCQHYCHVDSVHANSYKCSCMSGYQSGTNIGVDDHLCFFDDQVGLDERDDDEDRVRNPRFGGPSDDHQAGTVPSRRRPLKDHEHSFILHPIQRREGQSNTSQSNPSYSRRIQHIYHLSNSKKESEESDRIASDSASDLPDAPIDFSRSQAKLSPQERCNMFCEENKICALEKDSRDSYRCVCERQGFVSIGDRCLNWCSAVQFSYKVRDLLEGVCLSGMCRPTSAKPSPTTAPRESSWRPLFECDCSNSHLLVQDKDTKLCKLNFRAVLEPCLPGNVGHTDCVVNKNAFCSVLYRPAWLFLKGLRHEFSQDSGTGTGDEEEDPAARGPKLKLKDKLYTCVCSPEKKFLVDKPRNKARCIDECDLLNNECGRFNRMCRPATIAPDDFGERNLVRFDPDGARMDFRRTGCECLPGFNVGPYETTDFTLDDNYSQENQFASGSNDRVYPHTWPNIIPNYNTGAPDEPDLDHPKVRYMNINSRCLLDFDVVEFRASFKVPSDFDPIWLRPHTTSPNQPPLTNPALSTMYVASSKYRTSCTKQAPVVGKENYEGTTNEEQLNSSRISFAGPSDQCTEAELSADGSTGADYILQTPDFMRADISELHKNVVLVGNCEPSLARLSLEAYKECIEYRYWIIQKLRNHFVDWRVVLNNHLSATFNLMEGNIRLHVDKCESRVRSISSSQQPGKSASVSSAPDNSEQLLIDPAEQHAYIDADVDCFLTLRSANEGSATKIWRKVSLEKQLPKLIFMKELQNVGPDYYLMAPNMLIRREFFDGLAEYKRSFNPCESDHTYCDRYTRCEMVDIVNFTCTCETGYTPIGSRDIYFADSRKEVCEDINECLFDVCKDLANVSTCINEIGDYKCLCNRHYIGDNKKFCTHVCNTIPCIHGRCRLVDDHHAFCQCDEGYKETDCSVQDPNVALRKANMIICGSIFTSVLLLALTFAINLNSQLKKTKKKLKRLESLQDASSMIELAQQQAFTPRLSKISN